MSELGALLDNVNDMSNKELLSILDMSSDWASSEDCKYFVYRPVPISTYFHSSPAKIRAFFGGNRSSKTYSHVMDYAIQFTGKPPKHLEGKIPEYRLDQNRRLRLCMEDYPNSFLKIIWPYIQQLVPRDYICDVVKGGDGRIKAITNFKGGFIEFMQYDQGVTKFQGSSRHSVGSDEEPPEDVRDENLMRIVDTDGDETFSLTPVSGALKYLYDKVYLIRGREVEREYDFILDEKGRLANVIPKDFRDIDITGGDKDTHVFFANIFDNPVISTKAAIRILSKFPKEEMIVRAKGHFMFLSGLVYKEWNENNHVIDPFNAWHMPDTQRDYTLYVALDTHPRTDHAALFLVVRRDGLKFLVDEIFSGSRVKEFVQEIKDKCMGVVPRLIICDPLAWEPDPATRSCLAVDMARAGLNNPLPRKAPKAKSRGILLARQELTLDDRGYSSIYVTSNCVNFRREISHYAWDNWKKSIQSTKGEKQKPIDKDDHFMEDFYRLILMQPTWVPPEEYEDDYQISLPGVGASPVTGY